MSTKPPAKRDRDNAFPPRPGSGPKPEFDDQRVRSTPLEPRTDEPGEPEPKTEEPKDPAVHWLEQVAEYERRLRGHDAGR